MMKYLAILLLVGIICFWFFGSTQPIVVVDNIISKEQQAACPQCGGDGTIEVPVTCPQCKGTGKGEWFSKSKSKHGGFDRAKPICADCAGKGKVLQKQQCPQCRGAGKITEANSQKIKTVRADLSLWEKTFSRTGVGPDKNCAPQRKINGSYPMIVKYIETVFNPAYHARVIKWFPARLDGNEWIIKTLVEFKDPNGRWVEQGREFVVENRQVKESRKI